MFFLLKSNLAWIIVEENTKSGLEWSVVVVVVDGCVLRNCHWVFAIFHGNSSCRQNETEPWKINTRKQIKWIWFFFFSFRLNNIKTFFFLFIYSLCLNKKEKPISSAHDIHNQIIKDDYFHYDFILPSFLRRFLR